MLVIFPILFCFSFFIWSCSVLMMQIVRCESAVTQGLRSDILQATKKGGKRKHATPTPSLPLARLLWTSPHSQPASLPNAPNLRFTIGFFFKTLYLTTNNWLDPNAPSFNSVATGWNIKPHNPLYSEILPGCWVCASLVAQVFCPGLVVCSSLIWPFSERSSDAQQPLPGARSSKRHNMVNCGGSGNRHTPRACVCLRMHYRDHHLHKLSFIPGCDINGITTSIKLLCGDIWHIFKLEFEIKWIYIDAIQGSSLHLYVETTTNTECVHNCRMRAYVWVLVGFAQRRKKQCSLARQTFAHASPCCRLTFCHHGE